MNGRTPVPLTSSLIELGAPEFQEICGWPFGDDYVGRLLRFDIPQRVQYGECRVWIYRNPDAEIVGFGTFDICDDYRILAFGSHHPYIPLLAVNPSIKSLGYGSSIVQHLIGEAALYVKRDPVCQPSLFLDVYAENRRAIDLYERCGFVKLECGPCHDSEEGGKEYFIMARNVESA